MQGFAVLSVDLDIVLFKNPLDPKFNPLMNRELDVWTAVDNGKMLNCGFYFVRPTEPVRNDGPTTSSSCSIAICMLLLARAAHEALWLV